MTLFVVDRFYYKGNTCSGFYDADRYEVIDVMNTFSKETINSNLNSALHHMIFICAVNILKYLEVRFSLLNSFAKHYELARKSM